MDFTRELKEIYSTEIIAVRGNSDAIAITLVKETNSKSFIAKLKSRFRNLNQPRVLFIRCEDDHTIEKIVLV
ncbi:MULTISPECIES: hypothetical protein [unclassified Pedobacter]|jgi:predicted phosphodiesterase|uniref:hypothetical protein n=1 Tax=Pedobacter TaxID=84567 RepID=UPI000B4B39E6|nr:MULTISPECIES: hypothetical protein [unclassified Pedobacter]MCX2430027.1 hypothetical protein [Pedobacter sp. GR22-10]MCX2586284.1 hypothetical protein [Pedobacter sp. MR22-3]OWK69332.1 hypothetical protein CBW18_17710 [Pedobacter sp. AJM]